MYYVILCYHIILHYITLHYIISYSSILSLSLYLSLSLSMYVHIYIYIYIHTSHLSAADRRLEQSGIVPLMPVLPEDSLLLNYGLGV